MTINTLFIYHTYYEDYSHSINNCSDNFLDFNYIDIIKEQGEDHLNMYIKALVDVNKINNLFILLDKCDCSLDIDYLYRLKKRYSLNLVFIFQSSQNSFEYIDRYYAQIADMNIINDIPYIKDFYNMLYIPISVIDEQIEILSTNKIQKLDFDLSGIFKKNVFSSAMTNLSKKVITKYKYSKINNKTEFLTTQRYEHSLNKQKFNNSISNIFKNLYAKNNKDIFIIKDKKFEYSYDIYKIYWCVYRYIKTNSIKELKPMLKIKYLLYIVKIFRLYKVLKNNNLDNSLENINNAFYKEYIL